MPLRLEVHIDGSPKADMGRELPDGTHAIGSAPSCRVKIEHSEVRPQVASITVAGDSCRIQNLTNYPMYLGDRELSPNDAAGWSGGVDLLLTRSVTLSLLRSSDGQESSVTSDDVEEDLAEKKKKLTQIGVILACAIAAPILLWNEPSSAPPTSFDSLYTALAKSETTSDVDQQRLIVKLQSAWEADIRSSTDGTLTNALRELADDRAIQNPGPDTVEEKIQQFTHWKLSNIGR